jgi:hypothetical protein
MRFNRGNPTNIFWLRKGGMGSQIRYVAGAGHASLTWSQNSTSAGGASVHPWSWETFRHELYPIPPPTPDAAAWPLRRIPSHRELAAKCCALAEMPLMRLSRPAG